MVPGSVIIIQFNTTKRTGVILPAHYNTAIRTWRKMNRNKNDCSYIYKTTTNTRAFTMTAGIKEDRAKTGEIHIRTIKLQSPTMILPDSQITRKVILDNGCNR